MRPKLRFIILLTAAVSLICGCQYLFMNLPPTYKEDAQKRLEKKKVDQQTQTTLFKRQPLSDDEIELLMDVGNAATRYYLAGNTNMPPAVLKELGKDKRLPVRQGYLRNPTVPIEDVLQHRVVGKWDLINDPIARNPAVPPDILREMYANQETGASSFARNPNCPEDLMWDIYRNGASPIIELPALAGNRNAPDELLLLLEEKADTGDRAIKASLASNPKYKALKRTTH